ncbi:MAG TPA: hypothetical protein ACFYD4_04580 [Candidatus Wunengus sp. YC61]|uniref:hypothetical protein n=1 Tax=Candidatus Wunengus sp. YC61 TaxID=3367698 RepID=UPI004027B70B
MSATKRKPKANLKKHRVSFDEATTVLIDTEHGSNIRIISCRKATPSERKLYEEGSD